MKYTVTYWMDNQEYTQTVETEEEAIALLKRHRNAFDPSVWIDGQEAVVLVGDRGDQSIQVIP